MEEYIKVLGVDVHNRTRKREVVIARQLMWLMLKNSGWSYSKIGREFGYNYTTIISGVKSIKQSIIQKDEEALFYFNKLHDYISDEKER